MKENTTSFYLIVLFLSLFFVSTGVLWMNVEATLVGYEIGSLKNNEHALLKKKNTLTLELTKIMEKSNLIHFMQNDDKTKNK